METDDIIDLTDDEIIDLFISLSISQGIHNENDNVKKYNIISIKLEKIDQELINRTGDLRRLLIPHLEHANIQVRLNAATHILTLAPEAARRTLKEISDSQWMPFALDAGMTLHILEAGLNKHP